MAGKCFVKTSSFLHSFKLPHISNPFPREGLPDKAPFDAIHCGAAAATVPDALLNQLARGGRLIIPVGHRDDAQQLVQIDKLQDDTLQLTRLFGVRYVELVQKK
uniref:protein-L-isoaspartate(D-aspartate) O-methyltransferase n=1 Tax=Aureoumbra lagunensis TaxID=44058 RepID=A0A7S3JTC4_9STRA|mmetsp:Transcript_12826/g.17205  ORF Transcript_12826/g.17205 Transcript_12826/m.17205 type:complete len:104 (+) Transcript_12826:296-607(+)